MKSSVAFRCIYPLLQNRKINFLNAADRTKCCSQTTSLGQIILTHEKGIISLYTKRCYKSLKIVKFPKKHGQWIGESLGYILNS